MFSRRQRTALLASGALLAGLLTPFAVAAPAYAAEDCDLGGFEIDGDKPVNCPPGVLDWDNVDFDSTTQGGTYSASSKDVDDPSTWSSAGSTPDKADFKAVYSYAQVGADGHYYLYVAWERTGESGTGKYAIDLSFAGVNVADDGAPQPLHDEGGIVAYINMNGGDDPVLGQLCPYDDQADYPDNVNTDPGDCTTDTTGFASAVGIIDIDGEQGSFFEVGLDLTELADVAPGCPPVTDLATVYMRSITGGNAAGNLKGYVDPLTVTPPSTCGALEVTKESLNDLATDDPTVFEYDIAGLVSAELDGLLQIGETDLDTEVEPGDDYTLTETIPEGAPWAHVSTVCTVDGVEYTLTDPEDTFPVVTGETTSCVITNATSFVEVEKQTLPDGSPELFDFTIDGAEFDLSDGQTESFQFAPASSVDIIETVPDGWTLTDVTCDTDQVDIEGGATVTTIAGETVSCLFENTQGGTIIIHKVVDPAQSAEFGFTSETLGDFTITTDAEGTGTETFENLEPGSYDVTEPQTLPFDTTNLVCDDPTEDTTTDETDWSAAIELSAGETVECTYTNTERGRILVDKDTVPADYDQGFDFVFGGGDAPVEFTLNDASDDEENPWDSGLIVPGTYTVVETVPEHWTLDDIDCGTREGDGTTIELAPGEVVTCVFTNVAAPGSVSLTKSVDGVADGYDWSFDFTLTQEPDGAPVTQTVDSSALPDSATTVWGDLTVGEQYTLIEGELPFGWTADDIVCTGLEDEGEADGFQFTVTPGLALECTALNTAIPAEVVLTKTVTGLADGAAWSFDFTITPGPDSESDTQTATNEAPTIGWSDLLPGLEYTITEAATPGWVNGDITCIADVPEGGPLDDLDPEADGYQFLARPGLVLDCSADNEALPGTITVTKSAEGGDGTFAFTLTPKDGGEAISDSVTTVDGTGSVEFEGVLPGASYAIAETNVPSGWEAGSLSCTVESVAGGDAVAIDAADFEVMPGDEVACAITNTLRPPMPVTGVNLAAGGGVALLLLLGGGLLFLLRRKRQIAE
ncbi:hypothetical protein JOE59_000202 [Agromyces cerinus]|uniref:prealbumin-like fold domain-containing protein n=1 Tax=Agromyces cerinus TaxID=33878 RepID=UPI001959E061|nr:DUF5979 domain-containing protein [Agromyces cerinus]MBM7829497.1 hypothetical protein [Agromyces cerinus]